MTVEPIVVDAHTHIFNAEDLPIDGFVKELSPAPRILTWLVSGPLDALTSWLAPGPSREEDKIIAMLTGGDDAGFAVGGRWAAGSDLGQSSLPAEAGFGGSASPSGGAPAGFTIERRLGTEPTPSAGPPVGAAADVTMADIELALDAATDQDLRELDAWLAEWDEPGELEAGFSLPTPRKVARAIGRYVAALQRITKFRYLVAADIARTYPKVSLFVPALVDFTAATSDRPATKVRDQVRIHSFVAKLSVAGALPGAERVRFHPLVGFDPLREVDESELRLWKADAGAATTYVPFGELGAIDDRYHHGMQFDPGRARALRPLTGSWEQAAPAVDQALRSLDIVRYAIEQGGFAGVKIYPPAGFLPLGNDIRFPGNHGHRLDVAMRCLYAYCVEMDVPILTHAARSNGFREHYDDLAGPGGWEIVLAEFPKLRLCLGHFGHLHGVGEDPSKPAEQSWPARFVRLIDTYDNVYADVGNSKLPVKQNYRDGFTKLLTGFLGGDTPTDVQAKRRRRVLYGSDFWMNTLAPSHEHFLTAFDDVLRENFDEPTREGFMGMNALEWLGFIDGDRRIQQENKNRQRLVQFYGKHRAPNWLTGE